MLLCNDIGHIRVWQIFFMKFVNGLRYNSMNIVNCVLTFSKKPTSCKLNLPRTWVRY